MTFGADGDSEDFTYGLSKLNANLKKEITELKDCLIIIMKHLKCSNEPDVQPLVYLTQEEAAKRSANARTARDSDIRHARRVLEKYK